MTPAPVRVPRPWELPLAGLLLAGLIAGLHGPTLNDGLFMDDYAHFRQLREAGWSLAELSAACRLELVGGIAEVWWLPETTLRFFRPVSFGLLKVTYELSNWNPVVAHAMSLVWHWAVVTLLLALLRGVLGRLWLAWAVAAIFAVHPGHVATVQWIACQTELMVTFFALGATLCFARFRGWPGFAQPADAGRVRQALWLGAALLLFALALGCRENAIMLPVVLAAVEPALRFRRKMAALTAYGLLGAVALGYLGLRTVILGGVELPPPPYVTPPTDPGFLRFIADKLLYYLLGEFFVAPIIPIGGLPYLQERPLLFYSAAAAALLFVGVTAWRYRTRIELLGPVWLVAFFLPLLPVFAAPHHLYLPGVGWALIAAVVFRRIGGFNLRGGAPPTWRRRAVLWFCLAGTGGGFGTWTYYSSLVLDTGAEVEDCVISEILRAPRPLQNGDTLYIGNLPLLAHYVKLGIEERTGLRDLRVIPLTWSPRLLGLVGTFTQTELKLHDAHTLEIHVSDDRYFADVLGRLVRTSTGPLPDMVDRTADLGFRVEVLERDALGIRGLRFHFDRPLNAPDIHVFWGSRTVWALQLDLSAVTP